MRVDVIETVELGDRSYVVSDGVSAIVVDPHRDLDRVNAALDRLRVPAGMVLETHLQHDYLSGGHALARRSGATHVVCGREDVAFARCAVHGGDWLSLGSMTVRVVDTPGHTDTHLTYVVTDFSGTPPAVFSGGSLLYGSVGRIDLLGADRAVDLARKQWRSVRKLAEMLPDEAALYPTHGFGSFCSARLPSGGSASTIGRERTRNDALLENDEQQFVDAMIGGVSDYPAYCAHVRQWNAQGPDEPDLSRLRTMEPDELAARIRTGEWVVDLRDRSAYAGRHLAGTVSITIGNRFSTHVGSVIPWGSPITLISENPEQVAAAQRQLSRIGWDLVAGSATGVLDALAPEVPMRSYPRATFADVAASGPVDILDVRRDDEVKGSCIAGSVRVPLHALVDRMHEVPRGTVWVHCTSGFRAGIAASILDRAGHIVVHIDDEYAQAEKAGLRVVKP